MRIQKLLFLPISFLIMLSPLGDVLAQEEPPKIGRIFDVLEKISGIVFPLASLICLVFIIIGGYTWIVAAGDPGRVKQAQGTLTWAIIGLVVTLLSVAIVEAIKKAIGF